MPIKFRTEQVSFEGVDFSKTNERAVSIDFGEGTEIEAATVALSGFFLEFVFNDDEPVMRMEARAAVGRIAGSVVEAKVYAWLDSWDIEKNPPPAHIVKILPDPKKTWIRVTAIARTK